MGLVFDRFVIIGAGLMEGEIMGVTSEKGLRKGHTRRKANKSFFIGQIKPHIKGRVQKCLTCVILDLHLARTIEGILVTSMVSPFSKA